MTEPWTVRRVLTWTAEHFEKHQVDSPRLTAEILLAFALGVDRVRLYVDLDRPLNKDELAGFRALVVRRSNGEPTQYLVGSRDFYGRRFQVDPRVLIPRPETELLVEQVLAALPPKESEATSRVLDLCTGSGCIAVSVAAERPRAQVWAVDLSQDACEVARANATKLGVAERVTVLQGDLFAPVPHELRFDVVVSNPPYVRTDEWEGLQREVKREPRLALDGGVDGLDLVRRIAREAKGWLVRGGLCALEIGETQGEAVKALLVSEGYVDVRIDKDLARLDRHAYARLPTHVPHEENR